ncbi:3'(2'),5'-bisphosphate nucleotidase CysQ [Glaciecola sp. XM2]|jgi:3'(2'), 5'-bisphosphate nucleotidase|uniref:3'(2'),5'-bisphosphate nucleotidase CysQ n=1 Tax=Glaciecola sp. XM2 TaxID=1914931 RepID=UPI001BDE0639|nr:3'(2'),5'-bisphosphate nucleotidase CysQ [Glaciecola sp. XM2]MBT1449903.1 3'(2'),5'-bisphosphate nucleotidase CysQ [Glaciecola sp. XM2]
MSIFEVNQTLVDEIIRISQEAGDKILEIYEKDFAIYEKNDASPLTEADLAAHLHIIESLANITDIPILSEESADISWETRKSWSRYWLVDPLDGTKEFIKKNGEFTVNIALIEYGEPTLGVVHAPVLKSTYVGWVDNEAYKLHDGKRSVLKTQKHKEGDVWKVVGSRSHQSPEINTVLSALGGENELIAMGSSLKLCCVAEGTAHVYPRVGPTSEWDTAAAHAVVLAAGGKVTVLETKDPLSPDAHPLRYNQKDSILNPFFMVIA